MTKVWISPVNETVYWHAFLVYSIHKNIKASYYLIFRVPTERCRYWCRDVEASGHWYEHQVIGINSAH